MAADKTGGPAFPGGVAIGPSGEVIPVAMYGIPEGMSLRDYYAGLAMQGLLARTFTRDEKDRPFVEWVAQFAFEVADTMLVERAQ